MPYLLTATPSSPTSWVKMETESVLSAHSELSSRSRINNLNNKLSQRNNYISTSALPKSNLSVNNFPTLPPLPSMPPTLTSLSNYSLSRSILVSRSDQINVICTRRHFMMTISVLLIFIQPTKNRDTSFEF